MELALATRDKRNEKRKRTRLLYGMGGFAPRTLVGGWRICLLHLVADLKQDIMPFVSNALIELIGLLGNSHRNPVIDYCSFLSFLMSLVSMAYALYVRFGPKKHDV
jgi:hypothetical protein